MKTHFSFVVVLMLAFFDSNIIAQSASTTISGRVVSFEESTAIEGVNILVKGTKNYTGTQADGTFSIDVSAENGLLIFQHDEYETQEVKIVGKKIYDVVLKRKTTNAQIGKTGRYGLLNKQWPPLINLVATRKSIDSSR